MERKAIVPQYMQQFKCIGTLCSDTCCRGWQVTVDKDTYKKYRNCKEPALKVELDKKVTRNRSMASAENYAKIKMENNTCPFLTMEKLCRIQQELGEEYLSATCTVYPRNINAVNNIVEIAAAVSCPEAARLVLLNPEPMEFDEVLWEITDERLIKQKINTQDITASNTIVQYFWELRIFTIGLLQNRHYKLWERLIILGLFYQKLQKLVANNQAVGIPELIASHSYRVDRKEYYDLLLKIPTKDNVQIELLKALTEQRIAQGVNSDRYLEHLQEFLMGLGLHKEDNKKEISVPYMEAYQNYYQPFMKGHEYMLENFLVNHVFKDLFPLENQRKVFDSYVMLIIRYALIKMHLIGMAGYYKDTFTTEHILSLISSFSKAVEHNQVYLNYIHDLLEDNGFATMAYMAVLIKNG